MKNKKILTWLVAIVIAALSVALTVGWKTSASAADPICTEVITVVDEEAYTEEIVHPEVTEVVHHEAVTETVAGVWANWSPNDTQGPQDYVPNWPVDNPTGEPRGTWHIHDQGVPPGHEGPDGVYQQGQGNSPWFYRQAEKVIVIEEAYDEIVVVEEEWVEIVEHPAVTHEEEVEVDCPDEEEPPTEEPPVDPPNNPENPEEPPVNTPEEPKQPATPVNNAPPVEKKAPAVPFSVDAGM